MGLFNYPNKNHSGKTASTLQRGGNPRYLWLLPILSGIFIGTSYIPFPPWASLFCFVPLWLFWMRQSNTYAVFFGGLLTSFVFTLIGFNWVTYLLHEFAHLPWVLAVAGMLLYALIAHLYVPFAGIFWFFLQRKKHLNEYESLLLLALITTLCAFYSPTLFDWNFGYSWFGAGLPVYQWAEYIGFSGLGVITLLLNLPLYIAWRKRRTLTGKLLAGGVLLIFTLAYAGGLWLKQRLPEPDAELNVLLVQANIGNEEKLSAELGRGFRHSILQRYLSLTESGLARRADKKIDFVLWPESAFPSLLGTSFWHLPLQQQLSDFVFQQHTPLVTGAYSVDPASRLITNSLFVLNAQGSIVPPHYSKTILLAFGEYIPGEQWLPQLRDWLPPTGHFARGNGPRRLLRLGTLKMGAQICYEGLFPAFTRALANLSAQFIVNVTNDSWYGQWQEPYQHMYMTLARAIEFRRPVLRATNTGISTVALASGKILQRSPLHREWSDLYRIPYRLKPTATFYQRWFYLVPVCLWLSLGVMLVILLMKRPPAQTIT